MPLGPVSLRLHWQASDRKQPLRTWENGRAQSGLCRVSCRRAARPGVLAQMERSFALLRIKRIDLMQGHNLLDWQRHLRTLRSWKQDGRIRSLAVTHYTPG